jgi:hypothetical protein
MTCLIMCPSRDISCRVTYVVLYNCDIKVIVAFVREVDFFSFVTKPGKPC